MASCTVPSRIVQRSRMQGLSRWMWGSINPGTTRRPPRSSSPPSAHKPGANAPARPLHQVVGVDRIVAALEDDAAERAHPGLVAPAQGFARDDDAGVEVLVEALEARGRVDHVAERRVLHLDLG